MSKKILKIVDRLKCNGRTVKELRAVLRGIDSGEIVSVAFVIGRRDHTNKTYYDYDCPRRALGDTLLLQDYIRIKSFEMK